MSDWIDEGPSDADLERFNQKHDGYCPECSVMVYDDAEFCPECGLQIGGRIMPKPKVQRDAQHRLTIVVTILILIGFLSWLVF